MWKWSFYLEPYVWGRSKRYKQERTEPHCFVFSYLNSEIFFYKKINNMCNEPPTEPVREEKEALLYGLFSYRKNIIKTKDFVTQKNFNFLNWTFHLSKNKLAHFGLDYLLKIKLELKIFFLLPFLQNSPNNLSLFESDLQ